MGLYDSVIVDVTCPCCGDVATREVQFKLRDPSQKIFKVGHVIDPQYRWIVGLASCDACKVEGYVCKTCNRAEHSNSKSFRVKVFLDDEGCVTGEVEAQREKEFSLAQL